MIKKERFSVLFIVLSGTMTLTLIYLSLFKPFFQDEGVFLTISQEILDGKVPYRDFFDHKPPGIYFLLAPIVDIFSRNIWALKTFLFLNNFLAAFLVFLIANKLKRGSGVFASILFLFTATFFETNYLIAEPFMATFLLASLYFFIRSHKSTKVLWQKDTFLCGIMIGLSMLMKQTAVVNFFILAYFIYKDKNNILKYFAGAVLPWFPVIIYLLANNIFREAFNQIVAVNLTSYPREPLVEILRYISGTFKQTLPVWILFGIGFLGLNPRFYKEDKVKKILLAFIFLPIPLLLVRHYPHYWLQIVPFVAILAGITIYNFLESDTKKEIKIFALTLVLISLFLNLRWFLWMAVNQNGPKLREQMEAANYLKTLPQKKLLAENQFTAFYFLTGKEPLTKYLYITEVNESERSEEITIEKLKQNPDTVILWPKDKEFAYAKGLQEYIFDNFKTKRQYHYLGLIILENKMVK